jgi:hypothetical protein
MASVAADHLGFDHHTTLDVGTSIGVAIDRGKLS